MPRSIRQVSVASLALALAIAPRTASAQDAFAKSDQVARLNELLADGSPAPARLVEASRLLSDPKDQVAWLAARAESLDAGETAVAAKELANLTDQRADGWSKLGVGGLEPLRERLKNVGKKPVENANENRGPANENENRGTKPPARLVDITDPQALAAELTAANSEQLERLPPAEKALLWARGVSNSQLGINANKKLADWDLPRNLVVDLGSGDNNTVLNFGQLLSRAGQVQSARNAARAGPPFADASCTTAAELYSLALGMGSTAAAANAANALEGQNAWAWAALARIAEAAAPGAGREAALGKARQHLASLQTVQKARQDAGVHIASTIAKWLERVERGGTPAGGDSIAAFDTSVVDARRAEKRALAVQCQQANGDAKFKLMQQAKAAELGLKPAPAALSMNELQSLLANQNAPQKPGIHLFLEMLDVGEDSCIGLVMGSKTGGLDLKDAWVVEWIGPASSADILSQATRLVGFRNEAKIIIAPDGRARSAGWAGEATLKSLLKSDDAWAIFVPTATVLKKGSGWKPVEALRYFFYAPGNGGQVDFKLSGAAPQAYGSPILSGNMGLIVVGLGAEVGTHATTTNFCARLMKAKRGGAAAGVFPVGYSK